MKPLSIEERLPILKEKLQSLRGKYLKVPIGEREALEKEARVIQNQINMLEGILEKRGKT